MRFEVDTSRSALKKLAETIELIEVEHGNERGG